MEVINAKDYVKDSEDKMKIIYKYITQAYRQEYREDSKEGGLPISAMPIMNLNIPDIDWQHIIYVNHINKSEDQYTKTFVTIIKTSPLRYLKLDINSKSMSASMYNFSIDKYNEIKVDTRVDKFYSELEGGERTKNYWNEMLNFFFTKNQIMYYKMFSIDLSYIEAVNDSINSFLTMDSYLNNYVNIFFSNYFKNNTFAQYMEFAPGPVKLKPRCLVKLKEYYEEELVQLDDLYKKEYKNYSESQIQLKSKKKIDYNNTLFKIRTPIILHLKDKLRGTVTLFPEMRSSYIMEKLHNDLICIEYFSNIEIGNNNINIKFWYCKNSFVKDNKSKKSSVKDKSNYNSILNLLIFIYTNLYTIIQIIYILIYTFWMSIDIINRDGDSRYFLWSLSFLDWIYYYLIIKFVYQLYVYYSKRQIVNIEPFENHYKDIKYYYLVKRFKMFSIYELQLIDEEYINYKKKVHKHYSNIRDINFVNEEEEIK